VYSFKKRYNIIMQNLFHFKSKRGGFTLIELLVVVAIISLLTSIVLSAVVEVKQKAQKAKLKREMNEFVKAIEIYKADNGYYPLEDTPFFCWVALYMSGNEGKYYPLSCPTFSNLFIPKYLPKLPSIINPVPDSTSFFFQYYQNSISNADTKYRCKGDINTPPYVILVYKSNTGINYDAIDWKQGYERSFPGRPFESTPTTINNFRCFSIQ
jgi:prepilin-type N-terminal cleavage/methylation domain-containing protein